MRTAQIFTRPGLVPLNDGTNWRLSDGLQVQLPSGERVTVPAGFKTDLASVPPLGLLGGLVMLLAAGAAYFWRVQWLLVGLFFVGFLICFASNWIKPYGRFTYAAVFHDYVFQRQLFSFTVCNWYLLDLMKATRTPRWERCLIWFNVQLFGYVIYHGYRKRRR